MHPVTKEGGAGGCVGRRQKVNGKLARIECMLRILMACGIYGVVSPVSR